MTYIPEWMAVHAELVDAEREYNAPRNPGTNEGEGWNGAGYMRLCDARNALKQVTSYDPERARAIIEARASEGRQKALRSLGIYPKRGDAVLAKEAREKKVI